MLILVGIVIAKLRKTVQIWERHRTEVKAPIHQVVELLEMALLVLCCFSSTTRRLVLLAYS